MHIYNGDTFIVHCIIIKVISIPHLTPQYLCSLPAMDGDWTILSKLLFSLVHLSNKIDETIARLGHTLFRPICKLKLSDCS